MSDKKMQARKLRRKGLTTRNIAKLIGISKSVVHTWVKDIIIIDSRIAVAQQLRINGVSLATIARKLKSTPKTIKSWTKHIVLSSEQQFKIHSNKNKKYSYNEKLFLHPNNLSYYLLGVFISDGNVNNNLRTLRINSKDKSWLRLIADVFCKAKPIHRRKSKTGFYYELSINNKPITEWFVAHECIPRKSLSVKMPNVPIEYLSDFVRGIFDGDGNISMIKNKGATYKLQSYIVSGSKKFANSLAKQLNSIGIENKLYRNKTKNGNYSYRISWQGTPTIKFCDFIYQNDGITLKRKYNIYKKYLCWRRVYEMS